MLNSEQSLVVLIPDLPVLGKRLSSASDLRSALDVLAGQFAAGPGRGGSCVLAYAVRVCPFHCHNDKRNSVKGLSLHLLTDGIRKMLW